MTASKLFFLWLTILMFLPTACLAKNNVADSFPSAEELAQNWNANYGLNENYFDLQDTYGPIAFWSVERQYWFASIIRELCVLEQERLDTYYTGYGVSADFAIPFFLHRYGLPDETNLTEEEAKAKAIAWVTDKQIIPSEELDAHRISVKFFRDIPEHPMWAFTFHLSTIKIAEVWVDANDGQSPLSNALDIKEIARKALLATRPELEEEFVKKYLAEAFYDPEAYRWTINLDSRLGHGWTVDVDDRTHEVIEVGGYNG